MLSRTLADIKSLFFFRKPICRCSRLYVYDKVESNIDDRPPTANITTYHQQQQNPVSYFMHQGSQVQGVTSSLTTISCHDVAGFLTSTRPQPRIWTPPTQTPPTSPDRHRCYPRFSARLVARSNADVL